MKSFLWTNPTTWPSISQFHKQNFTGLPPHHAVGKSGEVLRSTKHFWSFTAEQICSILLNRWSSWGLKQNKKIRWAFSFKKGVNKVQPYQFWIYTRQAVWRNLIRLFSKPVDIYFSCMLHRMLQQCCVMKLQKWQTKLYFHFWVNLSINLKMVVHNTNLCWETVSPLLGLSSREPHKLASPPWVDERFHLWRGDTVGGW